MQRHEATAPREFDALAHKGASGRTLGRRLGVCGHHGGHTATVGHLWKRPGEQKSRSGIMAL